MGSSLAGRFAGCGGAGLAGGLARPGLALGGAGLAVFLAVVPVLVGIGDLLAGPGLALRLGRQAALEQLGQVDDIGAAPVHRLFRSTHGLQPAFARLGLHQFHDLVLEGVLELGRVPVFAHVLHQPLGHVQLTLVQVGIERLVLHFQVLDTAYLVGPAQGIHHQCLAQRHHHRQMLLVAQHHVGDADLAGLDECFAQ